MHDLCDPTNSQGRVDHTEPTSITDGQDKNRYDSRMPQFHDVVPKRGAGGAEYVVEFGFSKEVQESLDGLAGRLARHLGVRRVGHVQPRMTVAGPLRTNESGRLVDEVVRSAHTH